MEVQFCGQLHLQNAQPSYTFVITLTPQFRKRPRCRTSINERVYHPSFSRRVPAANLSNSDEKPPQTSNELAPKNIVQTEAQGQSIDSSNLNTQPETEEQGSTSVSTVPSDASSTTEQNDAEESNLFFALTTWIWRAFKRAISPGGFFWGVATGVVITIATFTTTGWFGTGDSLLREKVTLFDFILQDISTSYVDKVDVNRLFETGVNSMLSTLDPYTQFENNSQATEISVKTNGKYAGVGLVISLGDASETISSTDKERPIVVVSAFEGYAFDAGLRPGDVIEAVEGTPVRGASLPKVTDMLRGEPGTSVAVSVRREGMDRPLSFSLPRKTVQIRDVPLATLVGNPADGIGYIRLQSFAKEAASEVREALKDLVLSAKSLSSDGVGLKGLVLDLRGNPGGLLNAAIEVSEVFVPKDSTIVSTKGRGMGPGPVYKASQDPLLPTNIPLAVLVNGQTASASEIVAGAIQDLDYGIIVGSRTFGKGLVQNIQELPFNTALKYTVGKYYTPSGRCIQALNYEQNLDGDGPVEAKKVEESQRKEFPTRLGRVVRDGGGVEPDVEIQRHPSFLELALQRQNMYFRFATKYGAQLGMESLPKDFVVTDSLYREFVNFVTNSKFKYESRFDEAFEELKTIFKDVGYEAAQTKVNDLQRMTETEMKADFVRHERDIRSQIESAIRYRFEPDSRRISAELRSDEQLAEAVRVLNDEDEYSRLLSPGKVILASESMKALGETNRG